MPGTAGRNAQLLLPSGRIVFHSKKKESAWGRGAPSECLRDRSDYALRPPQPMLIEIAYDKLLHVP
jgi:hypothetical protein